MSVLRYAAIILWLSLIAAGPTMTSAQEPAEYENLQVLDPDTTRDELGNVMLQNLNGLGLPRRQREGCLFCHVGDMDRPVEEWDFASDDKSEKDKARAMMRMVREINSNHLATLDERIDDSFEVTCYTCHAGRTDPRPLQDILRATYATDGIAAAIDRYHELRERYYGAGAYDFRPLVLVRLAGEFARDGAWDDALTMARTNEEMHPGVMLPARARINLDLARTFEEKGINGALDRFDSLRRTEATGVVDYSILDRLAWGIYREDHVEVALVLFRKNLRVFPDEYIPNESLGDALWFSGDEAGGIEVFEAWVGEHPEHEMGRRRLLNMRAEI